MNNNYRFIAELVQKGGPSVDDYTELQNWFRTIAAKQRNGLVTDKQVNELKSAFGDSLSLDTVQGFSMQQPHGYAGDYEVIDRIHTRWISPKTHLQKWDYFFHAQAASTAVRNRKIYFQNILLDALKQNNGQTTALNVGSGPGRDMHEFFVAHPHTTISIDCVDMDKHAIQHASALNCDFADKISYHHRNIFRFKPQKKYDLVWSAGLFDYLDEKGFCFLLKRLLGMIKPGGMVIIGNFSTNNPSRDYMEFGNWQLHHRDVDQLRRLAKNCNMQEQNITVGSESEGVNLFLHVNCADRK